MMSTAKENSKETFDVNYITKLLKTLIRELLLSGAKVRLSAELPKLFFNFFLL